MTGEVYIHYGADAFDPSHGFPVVNTKYSWVKPHGGLWASRKGENIMVKTYLDILSERGIRPFLTDEAFEELQKFDYKSQYAIPGQVMPVFKHPNQHKIELGKTTNLIGDMCWYGASVEEVVRAIQYGMVVLDADKRHLDWKKAAEDFGIQELLKKYRRFRRKPKLTEREKLVITAYTGYVLEGTAGKVVDFVEQGAERAEAHTPTASRRAECSTTKHDQRRGGAL